MDLAGRTLSLFIMTLDIKALWEEMEQAHNIYGSPMEH
jgi:hypothetical protein